MPPINDPSQPENSGEFTPPPTAKPVDKPALPNEELKKLRESIGILGDTVKEVKEDNRSWSEKEYEQGQKQVTQAELAAKEQKIRDDKAAAEAKKQADRNSKPTVPQPELKRANALSELTGLGLQNLIKSNSGLGAILGKSVSAEKQMQMEIMLANVSAKESMKEFGRVLFPTFTKYGNQLGDYTKATMENSPTVKAVGSIYKTGQLLLSESARTLHKYDKESEIAIIKAGQEAAAAARKDPAYKAILDSMKGTEALIVKSANGGKEALTALQNLWTMQDKQLNETRRNAEQSAKDSSEYNTAINQIKLAEMKIATDQNNGIITSEEQLKQLEDMKIQAKEHVERSIAKAEEQLRKTDKFMMLSRDISEKESKIQQRGSALTKLKNSEDYMKMVAALKSMEAQDKARGEAGIASTDQQIKLFVELKDKQEALLKEATQSDIAISKLGETQLKELRSQTNSMQDFVHEAKKSAERDSEKQRESARPTKENLKKDKDAKASSGPSAGMGKVEGIIAIMLAMPVFIYAMKMMSAGDLFKSLVVVGLILGALYLMAKIPASNIDKLALGVVLFGASLVVLAFGAAKMASIGLGTLLKIGLALLGLTLAAKTMSKIPTANLFKLALGLVLLSGAIIVLSYGVKTFAAIGWETLAKLGAGLVGLGLAGFLMGKFAGQIMMGALAIAVLGASLVVLGFGVGMFEKIGWETMGKIGVAIVGLGLAAALMGGLLAVPIAIGTALLIGLGVAVVLLGTGLNLATPAIEAFGKVIEIVMEGTVKILDKFMEMGMAGPQILLGMGAAAVGIGLLGAALLTFSLMEGAGAIVGAVGGAISGVLGWFGGGEAKMNSMQMLAAMTAFGASAESLSGGVTAIESLGNALRNFSAIDGDMPALKKILDFLKEFQSHDSSLFGSIMKVATAIGIVSGEKTSTVSYEEPVAGKPQTAKKGTAKIAPDATQDERPGDAIVKQLMEKNVVVMTKLEKNLKDMGGAAGFSTEDRRELRKGGMSSKQISRAEDLEKQKYKSQQTPEMIKKTQEDKELFRTMMNSKGSGTGGDMSSVRTQQTQDMKQNAPAPASSQSTTVVNNTYNTTTPPASGGGGGGTTMIPMVLSTNNESTRNAVQVGFRPPG